MTIYKKRELKFLVTLICASLLLAVLVILKYKPYPEYSFRNSLRVDKIIGEIVLIEDGKKMSLEQDVVIDPDNRIKIILPGQSKLILKAVKHDYSYAVKGPDTITTADLNKGLNYTRQLDKNDYKKGKDSYYFIIKYGIPLTIVFYLWLMFAYNKKMGLYISFTSLAIGLLVSLSLIGVLKDTFKISSITFAPLQFFIFNIGLFFSAWLFFDRNLFIPEEMALQSESTDLILEGIRLYKKKDIPGALLKFKLAAKMDPERQDVAKLITVLETKQSHPGKLPLLINFKNRLLGR